MNTPQLRVMCVRCQAIFVPDIQLDSKTSNSKVVDVDSDNQLILTCPSCGHRGPAQRVMNVATFPSLEAFKHNWQASRASKDNE